MNDALTYIEERIKELEKKVKKYDPKEQKNILKEIKNLYVDIANALSALSRAQDRVRAIAQDFGKTKTSQTEVSKFYSFVKSQTSAELDLATLLDKAWNLIVMEDHHEAIAVLKQVISIDPQNIKGMGLMGLALMNKQLYDDAMLYLQRVLLIEPENPFALNNLGYICYKKGIWGEAIEHLGHAARQEKDRTAALYANYYLGLVYYERSMLPDAIKFFEEAVKLGPNLQEAYYYLGLSEVKRFEFKQAVNYFAQCVEIDAESKYGKLSSEEIKKIKPLTDAGKTFEDEDGNPAED
jgi:tetratricopeptide (TPR) repeat protein